jgi:N-acetyl sugar amidotransferase
MDTSDPRIVFDQDGYCNHCVEFLEIRSRYRFDGEIGRKKLDELVRAVKRGGRNSRYDCLVGMSGGVDSSFVAHLIHEKGLRPLAVHMDNGWDSEESVSNVRNVTTRLGIDYESYVLDWEEFRALQLSFLKASVPEAETPTDIAIPAALHAVAAKHKIKYIISAGNFITEGILPKSWHYNAKDMKYLNHIHSTFSKTKIKKLPLFDYKKETYYKLIKGIEVLYPLNYINFSQEDATKFLTENFGYKSYGEKHHESRYTRFIQSYYLFEKFGIDYRRARFSSEICCGQITRETALERLKAKPFDPPHIAMDKQYIAKKLCISPGEFEEILARPAKWHWDYPNDERKLGFVYGIYMRMFNKEKLANF